MNKKEEYEIVSLGLLNVYRTALKANGRDAIVQMTCDPEDAPGVMEILAVDAERTGFSIRVQLEGTKVLIELGTDTAFMKRVLERKQERKDNAFKNN